MPDTFRKTLTDYLVMLGVCLGSSVVAMVLWLFNRDMSWMGIAIPLFVYFDLVLLMLTTLGMWAISWEDRDARKTCDPILRRYERDGNVDDLLYGYELWRMSGHGMATRIDFLRAVIDLLVEDGYVYEAADLLADYQMIATTPNTMRDYRRFRKVCDRRMNAIVAEAEEQERRWAVERRAEESRRERRRRRALEQEEQRSSGRALEQERQRSGRRASEREDQRTSRQALERGDQRPSRRRS